MDPYAVASDVEAFVSAEVWAVVEPDVDKRKGLTIDDEGRLVVPEPESAPAVDSRDVGIIRIGSRLRDAAVDPKPADYLPPTNAGEADPHGPLVVSPEIHGSGPAPIVPGAVSSDADRQEAVETAVAEATLVEQTPVGDVTEAAADVNAMPPGAEDGATEGPTGDVVVDGGSIEPVQPKGNASKAEWVEWAVHKGMDRTEAEAAKVADLKAAHGGEG